METGRSRSSRPLALALLALVAVPAQALALGVKAPSKPGAPPKPAVAAAPASPAPPAAPARPALTEPQLATLAPRALGPAVMGGRVSDIAIDPLDPDTFYVAFATSGLWKTGDGGASFGPLFDKQPALSLGAVAVSPVDRRVIWAGTGEANDRNSSGWGKGVFRSTDGGATWTAAGLAASRTIARIVADPRDPAAAWVAATGDLWAPGGERGLYRTTDAGKTWTRALAAPAPDDAVTGCGDVALDPANPDVVYAALYARQRKPWRFDYGTAVTGGRDAGGIFRSGDGGRTWTRLAGGLPSRTGRIGLAVARSAPGTVYAIVQSDEGGTNDIGDLRSKRGGVFRTTDGGATWQRRSPLEPRAFYFSQVRVDPVNAERVYVLGYMLHVSEDGGATWREDLFGKVHGDCHALAIAPPSPAVLADARAAYEKGAAERKAKGEPETPFTVQSTRLVIGTDGGVYETYDGGSAWAMLDKVPAAQYYRVSVDDPADPQTPYRICGGLQDNATWVGPSRTWSKEGIRNADWTLVGDGDGFGCAFDADDRDVVYAEMQEGYLHRFNMRTGESKELRPNPSEGQPAFRFHWNAPLVASRHAKGTLYFAGNRVFRFRERGTTWDVISPDLSAADPARITSVGSGAENYGVVYALAESPKAAGLLWAGTDDGKLWVTHDDGATWTDLTASLPAAVRGQWLGRIEPSWHDPAVAYLAVPAYRSGQHAPLAFRTADGGRTWQPVTGNLPPDAPVHVVREDPVTPDVLYAGTEFGLYASLDGGAKWTRWRGIPAVRIDDVLVHPRAHDLVVATHGRGLYVVDDVTPLESLAAAAAKPVALFAPRAVFGRYLDAGWVDGAGKAVFRGENPPEGALISFWVREQNGEPVTLRISRPDGVAIAALTAPDVPGFGRVAWNLRPSKDLVTEYGGLGTGRLVPPGRYRVTISHGDDKDFVTLDVRIAEGIEPF